MKKKVLWFGIVLLNTLFSVCEVRAEVYTIQLGAFQKYSNADREYRRLKKSLPLNLANDLRIEKTGKEYILQMGRFEDPEQTAKVFKVIRDSVPDAFIRKGERISPGSEGQRPQKEKIFSRKKPENETAAKGEPSLTLTRALIYGTIKAISPFNPEQLGLPPGKSIYRLTVLVEETREVEGSPDFLREQKGQLMTLFSETSPSFFQTGKRISAVIEYRGNRFSRYYWVTKPRAI